MEKLSTKKKLTVISQYLSGLSYDQIATKSSVSKGTVANVVAELKAGRFTEAADAAEAGNPDCQQHQGDGQGCRQFDD